MYSSIAPFYHLFNIYPPSVHPVHPYNYHLSLYSSIHPFIYPSISSSIHQSCHLPVYLSIYISLYALSIHPSIHPDKYMYLSNLSVYSFICPCFHPSIHLVHLSSHPFNHISSIHLSIIYFSIHLHIYLFIYLSIYLSSISPFI